MQFRVEPLRGVLETSPQRAGKTSESRQRRLECINWIRDLTRQGLRYQSEEKQLLLATTSKGERLYVQYPGKESAIIGEKCRPWDFRPKVYVNGVIATSDKSFEDIWDTLFMNLAGAIAAEPEACRALGILFYRIAYMLDHGCDDTPNLEVRFVRNSTQVEEGPREEFSRLWRYNPPGRVLTAISRVMPDWGGISLEAFLHYNDLLAWNEDCKFRYPGWAAGIRDNDWKGGGIGRINTMLTHLRVIGLLTGDVKLSDALGGLARVGVSPATLKQCIEICKPLLGEKQGATQTLA